MRTVQPRIESIKLFGKDDHIPIICLSNEGYPFHLAKVVGFGQSDPHSIARVGVVGEDVFPFQPRHAWIFNAELFVACKWAVRGRSEKTLWIDDGVVCFVTAGHTDVGWAGALMGT